VKARRLPAAALAVLCAATVGAALANGARHGYPAADLRLSAGMAWLPSDERGELTLVDGVSATRAAAVTVAPARNRLAVVQAERTGFAVDGSGGAVVRVDTATLALHRSEPVAAGTVRALRSGGLVYVWNEADGDLRALDATTLKQRGAARLPAPVDAGTVTVDDAGTLWALDRLTGNLTTIHNGRKGVTAKVADAGRLLLSTVDGRPVTVAPGRIEALVDDHPLWTIRAGLHADDVVRVAPRAGGLVLAVRPRGVLLDCAVRAGGTCREIALTAPDAPGPAAGATVGEPVVVGQRAFVPDPDHGGVWVVDLPAGTVGWAGVFPRPRPFDLVTNDGIVFVNDPDSADAAVVGPDGSVRPVDKYGAAGSPSPGGSGSAAGTALPSSAPPSVPASAAPPAPGPTPRLRSPRPAPTTPSARPSDSAGPATAGPPGPGGGPSPASGSPVASGPSPASGTPVASGTASAGSPVPAGVCAGAWTPTGVPDAGTGTRWYRMTMRTPTDGWAVGIAGGQTPHGAAAHWDGHRWTSIPVGGGGAAVGGLVDVATLGPDAAIAVGGIVADPTTSQGVIAVWNGTSWTQVPVYKPPGGSSVLRGVYATSPSDVWVVGFSQANGLVLPIVLHWDGATWQVPGTPLVSAVTRLDAVGGTGPRDIWILGQASVAAGYLPVIEHWDGTAWHLVPGPQAPPGTGLEQVVTGGGAAWIAGSTLDGSGHRRPVAWRWNGSAWLALPPPDVGAGNAGFTNVSVSANGDAWFVGARGQAGRADGSGYAVAMRWNGRAWDEVALPSDLAMGGELSGIADLGDGRLLMTGSRFAANGRATPLSLVGTCAPG
jgi:hypothetical protein